MGLPRSLAPSSIFCRCPLCQTPSPTSIQPQQLPRFDTSPILQLTTSQAAILPLRTLCRMRQGNKIVATSSACFTIFPARRQRAEQKVAASVSSSSPHGPLVFTDRLSCRMHMRAALQMLCAAHGYCRRGRTRVAGLFLPSEMAPGIAAPVWSGRATLRRHVLLGGLLARPAVRGRSGRWAMVAPLPG